MINTLALLRDSESQYPQMWRFVVEEVHDDVELDEFIKSRYGSGCKVGGKVPAGQQGVYEVGIEEGGENGAECPHLHWTYASGFELLHCENTKKAIAMYLNGYSTFLGDARGFVTYDEEMQDSFSCEVR